MFGPIVQIVRNIQWNRNAFSVLSWRFFGFCKMHPTTKQTVKIDQLHPRQHLHCAMLAQDNSSRFEVCAFCGTHLCAHHACCTITRAITLADMQVHVPTPTIDWTVECTHVARHRLPRWVIAVTKLGSSDNWDVEAIETVETLVTCIDLSNNCDTSTTSTTTIL